MYCQGLYHLQQWVVHITLRNSTLQQLLALLLLLLLQVVMVIVLLYQRIASGKAVQLLLVEAWQYDYSHQHF
jgi:hypothetical protein